MNTTEKASTVEAFGAVTPSHVIEAIVAAAKLRDDLPDNFHKLPIDQRLQILGLFGPEQGDS